MSSSEGASAAPICQLKITLKGSKPPIWRRILVAGDVSLAKLNVILQRVMGWTDSHLHLFTIHGRDYGVPNRELDFGQRMLSEKRVRLLEVVYGEKDRFLYEYDFGDSWTHQIRLEKIILREEGKHYPVCVAGQRACPPEDCGGIWGYENFLEAIQDAEHPEHEETIEWIGGGFDAEEFNLDAVNQRLRRFR